MVELVLSYYKLQLEIFKVNFPIDLRLLLLVII
jgi:hypothetical protein